MLNPPLFSGLETGSSHRGGAPDGVRLDIKYKYILIIEKGKFIYGKDLLIQESIDSILST